MMVGEKSKESRKIIFPLTNLICWEIWKERNRRIFNKKELPVQVFIPKVMGEIELWRIAGAPIPLVALTGGAPFDPG
jgi:hypothetical protein